MMGPSSLRPNRLAQETSPYLLQHADNPVDWHPWGPAALALARELADTLLERFEDREQGGFLFTSHDLETSCIAPSRRTTMPPPPATAWRPLPCSAWAICSANGVTWKHRSVRSHSLQALSRNIRLPTPACWGRSTNSSTCGDSRTRNRVWTLARGAGRDARAAPDGNLPSRRATRASHAGQAGICDCQRLGLYRR